MQASSAAQVLIEYELVGCDSVMKGPMTLEFMPGGNAWYQALAVSNSHRPIGALAINGQALQPTDYGRWVWAAADGGQLNMTQPARLELAAEGGEWQSVMLGSLRSQTLDGLRL